MIKPDVIEELIKKKFGDDILVGANVIQSTRQTIIPATPRVDVILGGGVPEGSFVVITGPPKGGKSSLALKIAANAQEIKRKVYYLDVEARIKERDLYETNYIKTDPESLQIIKSASQNFLSGEAFLDIAEQLIKGVQNSVIIIDSFSAICTEGEASSDMKDRYRADSPLYLGKFCRRVSQAIPINNNIVIGITHMIANQGYGMSPWLEASGRKIQYQTDVKLRLTHFKPWKSGNNQIGQEVFWECQTSPVGPPGMKTNSFLRYGYGIDEYKEIIELAIDAGLVVKTKSGWLQYQDKKYRDEDLRKHLMENPDEYKELNDQIKCML